MTSLTILSLPLSISQLSLFCYFNQIYPFFKQGLVDYRF
jgi:hypothetical protein